MSYGIGRISTLQFAQMNRDFISRTSVSLNKASQELSTGRHADMFTALGASATTTLTLRSRLAETDAYLTSNVLLEGRLQVQLQAVNEIRDEVSDLLGTVLANATSQSTGAGTLQIQARTALEAVIAQLNVSFNGEPLFAGTRSGTLPVTLYAEPSPLTGLSPKEVINSIIATPPSSVAEVQSVFAELEAVFSSTSPSTAQNYEGTFYVGTPQLDGSGAVSKRVSARIEPGLELEYGLQANDKPFRDVIKGLSMLAAVNLSDVSQPDAYGAWMGKISEVLGTASSAMLGLSSEIGFRQQVVETAQRRLQAASMVQKNQIAELENVDPYEAATRVKALETQLRANYEITAQLSTLSLLNYL